MVRQRRPTNDCVVASQRLCPRDACHPFCNLTVALLGAARCFSRGSPLIEEGTSLVTMTRRGLHRESSGNHCLHRQGQTLIPNIDDRKKSFRWPRPDRAHVEISLGRVCTVGNISRYSQSLRLMRKMFSMKKDHLEAGPTVCVGEALDHCIRA
jgi:hypothetical protein